MSDLERSNQELSSGGWVTRKIETIPHGGRAVERRTRSRQGIHVRYVNKERIAPPNEGMVLRGIRRALPFIDRTVRVSREVKETKSGHPMLYDVHHKKSGAVVKINRTAIGIRSIEGVRFAFSDMPLPGLQRVEGVQTNEPDPNTSQSPSETETGNLHQKEDS